MKETTNYNIAVLEMMGYTPVIELTNGMIILYRDRHHFIVVDNEGNTSDISFNRSRLGDIYLRLVAIEEDTHFDALFYTIEIVRECSQLHTKQFMLDHIKQLNVGVRVNYVNREMPNVSGLIYK